MKHLYYVHAPTTGNIVVYIPQEDEICQIAEIQTYHDSDIPDDPEDTVNGWISDMVAGNEEIPLELWGVDLVEIIIHEL